MIKLIEVPSALDMDVNIDLNRDWTVTAIIALVTTVVAAGYHIMSRLTRTTSMSNEE